MNTNYRSHIVRLQAKYSPPSRDPADVAIIHAQRADRSGNVLIEGIVGVQKEAVLGAAPGRS